MCSLDVSKSQSLNHVYGHSSKFIQNLEHINLVSLTTLFLFLWGSSSHSSCSFGCCWSRLIRRPVIALHLETIIINKVRTLQGQPQCNSEMVTTEVQKRCGEHIHTWDTCKNVIQLVSLSCCGGSKNHCFIPTDDVDQPCLVWQIWLKVEVT